MTACVKRHLLVGDTCRFRPRLQILVDCLPVQFEHLFVWAVFSLFRHPLPCLFAKGNVQRALRFQHQYGCPPSAFVLEYILPLQVEHIAKTETTTTGEKISLFYGRVVAWRGNEPFHLVNGQEVTLAFLASDTFRPVNLVDRVCGQYFLLDGGVDGIVQALEHVKLALDTIVRTVLLGIVAKKVNVCQAK